MTLSTPLLVAERRRDKQHLAAPWREDAVEHVFAEIRSALAEEVPSFTDIDGMEIPTEQLQFMHLRHTAVTELSIAGASGPQIAAITDHSLATVDAILERYLVRMSAPAKEAMAKRIAYDDATLSSRARHAASSTADRGGKEEWREVESLTSNSIVV